ncbi:hypothetical protein PR048_000695 [Dryococelus australis]|uniref:Uncharacterized protein n=1 Tax=Dryococelus australis TaxID=614101 RepID=A0ABQ9IFC7_9NEOP|nr:hypothetical protein PR048_000695 [Dryococelus australis]
MSLTDVPEGLSGDDYKLTYDVTYTNTHVLPRVRAQYLPRHRLALRRPNRLRQGSTHWFHNTTVPSEFLICSHMLDAQSDSVKFRICGESRSLVCSGGGVGRGAAERIPFGELSRSGQNSSPPSPEKCSYKHADINCALVFAVTLEGDYWATVLQKVPNTGIGPWLLSGLSAHLPPRRTGFNPRLGHSRIFTRENRARRYHWLAGFLGDIPFPPPFHSGAALGSPQSPSSALETSLLRAAQISSLTHSLEGRLNVKSIHAPDDIEPMTSLQDNQDPK